MSASSNMRAAIDQRAAELRKAMRITIEPTGTLQTVNDAPCRVWNGITENGVSCVLYVALVQVPKVETAEFERALSEVTDKIIPVFPTSSFTA